jgi:hypothetical protein
MSSESLRLAGILLVVYPTVVFGGASILWHWITARTDYYDHALRQRMWAAGHAHAGVLLLLSLAMLASSTRPTSPARGPRWPAPARPCRHPRARRVLLSIASPRPSGPNRLVNLAYLGAVSLVVGMATLGSRGCCRWRDQLEEIGNEGIE